MHIHKKQAQIRGKTARLATLEVTEEVQQACIQTFAEDRALKAYMESGHFP